VAERDTTTNEVLRVEIPGFDRPAS
jgi:hypothetical protein